MFSFKDVHEESEEEEEDGMCEKELTAKSMRDLEDLAKKLLDQNTPCVVILNVCNSFYTQINDILISRGVFTALNLIKDNVINSNGKFFPLSEHQRNVLTKAYKVLVFLNSNNNIYHRFGDCNKFLFDLFFLIN